MPKLAITAAVVAAVFVVGTLGFRSLDDRGSSSSAEAEAGVHGLATIGQELLALTSLRATHWTGSPEGLVSEEEVHASVVQDTGSEPAEMALVELSNVGDRDNPPPHGYRFLESERFADLRGPVWVAVMGDRPTFGGEIANREDPDVTSSGKHIVAWYNLRFYNAESGEYVYGLQGEVTEGQMPN